MYIKHLICLLLLSVAAMASGQNVVVNGGEHDGYIGVYEVSGQRYWWLCVEPTGTPAANAGESYQATLLSLEDGWFHQNVERYEDFLSAGANASVLGRQVGAIEYVLDKYLPIPNLLDLSTLPAGSENTALYTNNEAFYNKMSVVQQFLAELYGKPAQVDFSDLSSFTDRWSGDLSEAGLVRSDLFQQILADLEGKDGTFFDSYDAQYDYYITNTYFEMLSSENWQDGLIVMAPVPEPGSGLLIACCGLAVMLRRWRKFA